MHHCSPTGKKPDGTKAQVTLNGIAALTGWLTPKVTDRNGPVNSANRQGGMALPQEWDDCAPTETLSMLKRLKRS